MNFINKKTSKQKVLNFALTLGRSKRVKKAPKSSSEYLNFLSKFLTLRKYLKYHINLCEAEISSDEIIEFR